MEEKENELVKEFDFEKNEHKLRENDLCLSDYQVEVLKRYNLDYHDFSDMKSLLFMIEDILEQSPEELEDLAEVADQISEFNYYNLTNK